MADAIAPYNFVPPGRGHAEAHIPAEEPPAPDRFDTDRYTGWFDLTYRTLTPIYTRGSSARPADFYNYWDNARTPVLPGSSLRGMVRALFEILTYSRIAGGSPLHTLFRRVDGSDPLLGALYRERYGKLAAEGLVGGVLREGADGQTILQIRKDERASRGIVLVGVGDPNLPEPLRVGTVRDSAPSAPGYPQGGDRFRRERGREPEPPVAEAGPRRRDYPHAYNKRLCRVRLDRDRIAETLDGKLTLPVVRLTAVAPYDRADFDASTPRKEGEIEGWLIVPGPDVQPREWYPVILRAGDPLAAGGDETTLTVPDTVITEYEERERAAHGTRFEDPKVRNVPRRLAVGEPAFALTDPADSSRALVIGPAMTLPVPFEQVPAAVFHRSGGDGAEAGDMARSVFGFKEETGSGRSRVFFEDAVCQTPDPWMDANPDRSLRVIEGLGKPRLTAGQMYLTGEERKPAHLDTDGATARGVKMYWHRSPQAAERELRRNVPDDRLGHGQIRIRPVRAGVVFRGRIRFHDLTLTELGALYASLHLPEGMAHRFGMGKPLGLGSLHIAPQEGASILSTTLLSMPGRYQSLRPDAGYRTPAETEETLRQAYTAFAEAVRRHETPNPKGASLWRSDRLRTLAALLTYDPHLPDSRTRNAPVEAPQWRNHDPLPSARDLARDEGIEPPRDLFTSGPTRPAGTTPSRTPSGSRADYNDGNPLPGTLRVATPQVGQTVFGTIAARRVGMMGDVELEGGGGLLTNQYVGMGDEGARVKLKIQRVSGTGQIKEVRRA